MNRSKNGSVFSKKKLRLDTFEDLDIEKGMSRVCLSPPPPDLNIEPLYTRKGPKKSNKSPPAKRPTPLFTNFLRERDEI